MFGIVGGGTEFLLWTATLGALVATVFHWHRVCVHNFRNIFIRVSAIFLIQFLFVASLGVELNKFGNFYSSWSDLLGLNNDLSKVAISPQSLATISANDVMSAKRTPGGSLIFREIITGSASNISNHVYVVASPSISKILENSVSPQLPTNYQVVELFPGYPGVPETWIGTLHGIETMENLEIAGKIPPTIAIIPSINVVRGLDTECLNIPGTSQVETWLTTDMRIFAQKFIGLDDRKWSTFGYSTGGWCAAELAIRHTDIYQHAISLAGYFSPSFSAGVNKRERNVLMGDYDLAKIVKGQATNPDLLIMYSKSDKFSFSSMNKFIAGVGTSIPIKLVEIPHGGHNIKIWQPFVQTGFNWLAQLSAPKTVENKGN